MEPIRIGEPDPGRMPVEPDIEHPEASPADRYIALGLFLFSAAYLCLFRRYTAMEPDEGIVLQGAQRILSGQVPYRDFFSFYTPGSYYFLALVFKVFGDSLVVARMSLAVCGAAFSVVTYLLSRRVCTRGNSLTVAVLVTLTAVPFRFLVLHNWDSTFWVCLALYCAVRLAESRHWAWALATGSLASLTVLFEQSKGAGLLLGLALGWMLLRLTDRRQSALTKDSLAAVLLGLAWPMAVTLAYFGWQHSTGVMLADWLWPLQHYSLANRVPYGYQNWSDHTRQVLFATGSWDIRIIKIITISPVFLIPVLPLIAVGLLAYWIGHARKQPDSARSAYYLLVTSVLAGLLLSVVAVRADILHFVYLLPLFALVLVWILDGRDIPGHLFRRLRPYVKTYVCIAFLALGMAPLFTALKAPNQVMTRRGLVKTPRQDTVVEYVQAHVPAGSAMLVYPYLPLYYYLTDTHSPSRLEYFQPGMHTAEQAGEMLRVLQAQQLPVVLYESSFAGKVGNSWPKTPVSAFLNDPVADFLAKTYRACQPLTSPSESRFLFLVRKDLACF